MAGGNPPAPPAPPAPSSPVVLVHGLASSFEHNWAETGFADLLADAGREVVPVDLLGHGSAPTPHDPAAYADLEARVALALPAVGTVDAVGFSLGARVVLRLATMQPERFTRLVVAGVGTNLFQRADYEPLAHALETDDVGAPGPLGLFVRFAHGSGSDRLALAACLRRPEEPLTSEELARVSCPVLVVLGDRDFVGPADPLLEALPDARLVMLRGVDHFATLKHFGFIDAALGFLGEA